MKIKITLIAFFVSALLLTSCMKNEVSPGIEAVRTAYAKFLEAKGQALLIKENADAALQMAKAKLEEAHAAYRLAEAAGVDAATATTLEALAQAIEMNKVALAAAQRAEQALLDIYNKGVQDAKEALVAAYLTEYIAALEDVEAAKLAQINKMEEMAILALDLLTGKTDAIDAAIATLAEKEAELAAFEAELVAATATMGDVAAVQARIAELMADTLRLKALKLTLANQAAEIEHDADAEEDEEARLRLLVPTIPVDASLTMDDDIDNARAQFQIDYPVPAFWQTAIDSLIFAEDSLVTVEGYSDAACDAFAGATDTIALGVTDINADSLVEIAIVIAQEEIVELARLDTVSAFSTFQTDSAAVDQLREDTADWNDQILVLADSAADQRARWLANTPSIEATADSTQLLITVSDSNLLAAQVTVAELTEIPALASDSLDAANAWDATVSDYDSDTTITNPLIRAAELELTSLSQDRTDRIARIAYLASNAQGNLADLESECLHWQSYIPEVAAWVVLVDEYKESLREQYEEYMDESFADYYANILQDITNAHNDYLDLKDTYDDAKLLADDALTLFTAADKPYQDALLLVNDANDELLIALDILLAYTNAGDYHDGIIAALETLVTNATTAVTNATTAIATAEATYAAGEIDYERLEVQLANIAADLATAEAQLAYFKALLDEALAN